MSSPMDFTEQDGQNSKTSNKNILHVFNNFIEGGIWPRSSRSSVELDAQNSTPLNTLPVQATKRPEL